MVGERYTQSQGVKHQSLTTQGYEGSRIEKFLLHQKTPAGTPYQLGLKVHNPSTREPQYSDREQRRRRALNLELDALGVSEFDMTQVIQNNPDKAEEWIIQKKTKDYTVNFQLKCKQKSQRELIQLLRH